MINGFPDCSWVFKRDTFESPKNFPDFRGTIPGFSPNISRLLGGLALKIFPCEPLSGLDFKFCQSFRGLKKAMCRQDSRSDEDVDWNPEIPFENLNYMRDSMDEETASLPPTDEQKVRKPSTHRPLTPTVSEEVEELIEQSIEIESNKKMRKDHLSWFSLTFRSPDTETKFHQIRDRVFRSNTSCAFAVWIFVALTQIIMTPKSLVTVSVFPAVTLILGATFAAVCASTALAPSAGWARVLGSALDNRRPLRNAIFCATVAAIVLGATANMFSCDRSFVREGLNQTSIELSTSQCTDPQYFVLSWILTMVACVSFLKVHYLLKLGLLVFMLSTYILLMIVVFSDVFEGTCHRKICVSLKIRALVLLTIFFYMVSYHADWLKPLICSRVYTSFLKNKNNGKVTFTRLLQLMRTKKRFLHSKWLK
ncbi:adenylyl cyclase 78C [Trichonephila inaurata madagascariensis]|uniref:Adenylyl cyclase 78C n=2 Tax=Trichonephila TaxID=2585208 RepID=A0A8X6MA63_9ARAC|nr:adenylyl cyclase 78C [Trichonephila inaurata madagascariensis]